ncbi:transcriptional regulator [Liquorilactobacillus sucicola DSM 21376 = JCM 15457]|nr:transcriptional regulator [Liquorilactobacillus sucicola DSM 21376 = JCM 15457]
MISNSGEARSLLKQMDVAHKKRMSIIAITNRPDSPIALKADLHLTTAVRQKVLQSEYYFSRVAALTVVEALYLLLLSNDKKRLSKIREHEDIISDKKV